MLDMKVCYKNIEGILAMPSSGPLLTIIRRRSRNILISLQNIRSLVLIDIAALKNVPFDQNIRIEGHSEGRTYGSVLLKDRVQAHMQMQESILTSKCRKESLAKRGQRCQHLDL